MTTLSAPICLGCKHLVAASKKTPELKCAAYPAGIPDAIVESRADHRKTYRGDNGIQFSPVDAAASKYAALLFEPVAK